MSSITIGSTTGGALPAHYTPNAVSVIRVHAPIDGNSLVSAITMTLSTSYPSAKAKAVVYDATGTGATPHALLGASAEMVGLSAGSNTFTFSPEVTLIGGRTYYIGITTDTSMNTTARADFASGYYGLRSYASGVPATYPTSSGQTNFIPEFFAAADYTAYAVVPRDPLVKRGAIRTVIGVEVDTLNLTLMTGPDVLVQGVSLAQFAREGGFDGARVQLDRYFSASWEEEACGSLNLFSGRVSEITMTGTQVQMAVVSDLELLNIQMPRNLYMAPCIHTLYDAGCGLSAGAFTVTGNTAAGSLRTSVNCNLGQAAGYFNLGTIKFTTGSNTGVMRTVKVHTSGVIVPSFPFPYAPATGDHFEAKPGCDKLFATCNATFSNTSNFRGYEFIPSPELTY